MPKGEYDTPGPFRLDDKPGFNGSVSVYRDTGEFSHYLGSLSPRLDEAERDELVGLLNKGTHYNALLEALKTAESLLIEAVDQIHGRIYPEDSGDLQWIRAVIAKAETGKDS